MYSPIRVPGIWQEYYFEPGMGFYHSWPSSVPLIIIRLLAGYIQRSAVLHAA